MTLDELVGWFKANHKTFFHFTDTRNIPLIQQHGLLSRSEMAQREIQCPAPGGNQWSFDADALSGMDQYVHLCFRKKHPMEYMAKADGRIETSRFLLIEPDVLLIPGTKLTSGVSNKNGVAVGDPIAMLPNLDWEVLYLRTDWRDPAIQSRLRNAEKYEVIVPSTIPSNLIRFG
jgi:hypothetical protein